MNAPPHAHTCTCTQPCTRAHTCTPICVHRCPCKHARTCVEVHASTHMYTHIIAVGIILIRQDTFTGILSISGVWNNELPLSGKPPQKGVLNVSSPTTPCEKEATAQATPRDAVGGCVCERRSKVCYKRTI